MKGMKRKIKLCKKCEIEFDYSKWGDYCSRDCAELGLKKGEIIERGYGSPLMWYTIECAECGKMFDGIDEVKRRRKYCSIECRSKHYSKINKETQKNLTEEQKERIRERRRYLAGIKRQAKKKKKTLSDYNREAREMHMTYGKYMEWLRTQELTKGREKIK